MIVQLQISQKFVSSSIEMAGWSTGAAGAGLHLVITSISHSDIWIMRHRDSGVGGPSGCTSMLNCTSYHLCVIVHLYKIVLHNLYVIVVHLCSTISDSVHLYILASLRYSTSVLFYSSCLTLLCLTVYMSFNYRSGELLNQIITKWADGRVCLPRYYV